MGSSGPKLPTLEELAEETKKGVEWAAETTADVGAAIMTGGYTQTESGKKDWQNIKRGVKQADVDKNKLLIQVGENLLGETTRKSALRVEQRALADQAKRESALTEQEMRQRRMAEYGSVRTRQRALMGQFSGRSGTILTGTGKENTNSLGSAGSGKTLLGS